MKVIVDIECNSLHNPTKIWLIVLKDIDTEKVYIFRNLTEDEHEKKRFLDLATKVNTWAGHNICGYDIPVLERLLGLSVPYTLDHCVDTLIISKLVDYSRSNGHSLKSYGEQVGLVKYDFSDWTKWSQEMEDYCVRDVDISHKVYNGFEPVIVDPLWRNSIETETRFQQIINGLCSSGFYFNHVKGNSLLDKVTAELSELDVEIANSFPPKLKLVREVTPVLTKYGTLNKKDFRWVKDGDLSDFNGGPFSKCVWSDFNPSSHKQIIEVLHRAGWKPVDKTKTHIETEREINRSNKLDLTELSAKLNELSKFGWRVNENNLQTLPSSAPKPARTLAKRILLEARRRTLTEWLELVGTDGRIHGKFYGIGAWTHRMAHQNPNTANIPTEAKLFGKEMRSLWTAPKDRLLVGVDVEGMQLRVFAHYIKDKEFIEALVNGRKEDKTDPHSLNERVLDTAGITRDKAKKFIFAYILGGGVDKLSEILGILREEGQKGLNRLIQRYSGLGHLKRKVIPTDAERGYFIGLDGRRVPIPGDDVGYRKHLCMSGYLQNGESVIVKMVAIKAEPYLKAHNAFFVDIVHDEFVIECPDDLKIAEDIKKHVCQCIADVGRELKLNCPMKGDGKIGNTWYAIH